MLIVKHASSTGPDVVEEGGGGEQQASCLVAKQTVEFPQVYWLYSSGGSRGVRSSSDEPPFSPSDQLTASNFSTPKISVLGIR